MYVPEIGPAHTLVYSAGELLPFFGPLSWPSQAVLWSGRLRHRWPIQQLNRAFVPDRTVWAFEDYCARFEDPVMNEVGTGDVWPVLAATVTTGYGPAGTYGFRCPYVVVRWHNGETHSAFLDPKFCRNFWVPYLRDGTIVAAATAEDVPVSARHLARRIALCAVERVPNITWEPALVRALLRSEAAS
jgi:hypothetical protein